MTQSKPNVQASVINICLKTGLILAIFYNNSISLTFGYYHFISLYGSLCFAIAAFIEYRRDNFILTVLAVIGIITYQPFYSVLKDNVYEGEVTSYWIIFESTVIVMFFWIIFDIIRWVRDVKRSKKAINQIQ